MESVRPARLCSGPSRRDLLQVGGLSLLGISLSDLLRAQAAAPRAGRARQVVLLYLFGGPALQETFDPKPDAPSEFRGEFGSTPTSVPGVHFCEHLPRMARWMNRSALIRSATHDQNDHSAGLLYTMTGSPPEKLESLVPVLPTQAPGMSAVAQALWGEARSSIPASIWMPCPPGWGQAIHRPGPFAGWLGRRYDPFFTGCTISDPYQPAGFYDVRPLAGRLAVPDATLPPGLSAERFEGRRALLGDLGRARPSAAPDGALFDEYHRRAIEILTDDHGRHSPWLAFRLEEERPAVRDRYGRHLYGEATLTARRLIERGVRFVTVSWESFDKTGGDPTAWDTHENHFPILKDYRLPVLDQVYSALCEDLQVSGLLDETLVVVMGEMGRTPQINKKGGRDHWSYCHNILLTGAGVQHGAVHGSSDSKGFKPESDPVGPGDLIATVYAALGIDPRMLIKDAGGRQRPILEHGEPIGRILA